MSLFPRQNPILLKLASQVAAGHAARTLSKSAIVPPDGGGGGAPPPGGDPSAAGPPPGDPAAGGAPPPAGDPMGGGGGGPLDPAAVQQIVQALGPLMGGAGGKGKSPKDQIMAGQMKILISLVAQMASKQGIQVDPQLLVPATDPATDQMAMQEVATSSMAPSSDPASQEAGGAAPPPGGAAAGPAGPAPMQPMGPEQGPIGKQGASIGTVFAADDRAGGGVRAASRIRQLLRV